MNKRNKITGAVALLAAGGLLARQALLGAPTKVAAVVGWAGNNGVTTLWPNVQGVARGNTTSGAFDVAGLQATNARWSVAGSCHAITFSSDATGRHALVTGWVYYSAGAQKNVAAVATLTMTKAPSGAATIGIKVANWFTGAALASTGIDSAGNPVELPLIRGSIKIVP